MYCYILTNLLLQRIQNREVEKLHLEGPGTELRPEGLIDINEPENGDLNVDDRIGRYRELFAALLAA